MSQPRYGEGSSVGENMATGAVLAGGVSAGGGLAWRAGRRKTRAGLEQGAANRNFQVIRRAGLDAHSEADGALSMAQRHANTARRQAGLAARTRARLTPVPGAKGEKYTERGRRGFYPSRRLKALDAAAEGNQKAMGREQSRYLQAAEDSRSRLKQAKVMESRFGEAQQMWRSGQKITRIGRPVAVAAGLAAIGLGVGAEATKNRQVKARRPKAAPKNVVDLDRYRRMRPVADERGSALVDRDGYRKPLGPGAGANWLRNNKGNA